MRLLSFWLTALLSAFSSYNLAGQGESETITGGILDGVVIDPGHDALFRRTSLNAGGAGWTYQQTYGFDPAGRLNAIGFGDHSFGYGYLPNSNLIQTVTSRTAGNDILTATKTWDNLNRLYRIQSTSTATVGGLSQTFTYGYNRANQRTGVTREDGTRWDYGYDALGQVTGAVNREADGDPLLGREFGYAYDNIGNRTSATFGNNHTIGYTTATGDGTQYASITTPGVSVVTGEVDPTATVAINGTPATNRQSGYFSHEVSLDNSAAPAAATVNVAATLGGTTETQQRESFVPKAVVNPEYDHDGNLTFDGFLEYAWDAENRLIGVRTRPGLAPAGSTSRDFRQEMTYDHASRRIRCTTFVKTNGTEHLASDDAYVYDGWNQIAVLNALTRQPRQSYAWGLDLSGSLQGAGGVGGLLAVRDVPSGDTHLVSYDGNGNVTGLADAGSGAITASYEYDAFGNLLGMEGAFAARNPWRFSTKTVDRFTGHYYHGYRFFDPVAGRWLNRDPLEEEGGLNMFGFVTNRPISAVDPLGLEGIPAFGGDYTPMPKDWLRANPESKNPNFWHHSRQEISVMSCECNSEDMGRLAAILLEDFTPFNYPNPHGDVTINAGQAGFDIYGLVGGASDLSLINTPRVWVSLLGPSLNADQQAWTNGRHPLIGGRRWGHDPNGDNQIVIWTEAYEAANGFNMIPVTWGRGSALKMWASYLERVADEVIAFCSGWKGAARTTHDDMTSYSLHPWL